MGVVNSEGERQEGAAGGPTLKTCPSCGARYPIDALYCSLDGAPLTTSPNLIAAAAATDPYLGREILGHIEVRQLVGIGAMGRVYRAFQRGIDRDVAVKILHRELSSNLAIVARFHREAKVASRLSHPNVVHVLLVGQLPDGAMYIVMEYLDGMSLQSGLAAAGGAMPLPRALHIALQLCEAAGEAHAQGIVHRDLKPENVMLVHRADDPDFVKVLDFGIARLNWDEHAMTTAAGLIFGTARYISPEGAQGERVGAPGDVYSITTMVYQMLSGRTPFDGEQAVSLLVQQTRDVPPPLKAIARSAYVPDPVAAIVMKNLAKKADERASDARALGRALLEAAIQSGLSAQDILARPALLDRGRGAHASVVQMPSLQRTQQHTLEKNVAARIGAASQPESGPAAEGPLKTAYETPAPAETRARLRTEITPPGVETTRWSPDADFEARVGGANPGPETTLDEQHAAVGCTIPAGAPSRPTPPPAGRSSSVDVTLGGENAKHTALPARSRTVLLASALAGALGAVLIMTWKAGLLGGARNPSADRSVITAPASPGDLREPGGGAVGNPVGGTARNVAVDSAARAPEEAVPPLAVSRAPIAIPSPVAGAARVALEASSVRPGVGQPVDFVARLVGGARAKLEGPHFRIAGPGLAAGIDVPAADDGSGVLRTTFTFLQGGRFDVSFSAHAAGGPLRAARVVVVGEAAPSPATVAAPPASVAAPAAGASPKWL